MKANILLCNTCLEYSLKEVCGKCKNKTATPHPPRFSPEDRYGKYRRQLKAMDQAAAEEERS